MRRLAVVVVLVPAIARAAPAEFQESDPEPKVVAVTATAGETTATLRVRYTLAVTGSRIARNAWSLETPLHAAVVGATATVNGVAHPLGLDEADHAARQFGELEWRTEAGLRGSGVPTRWQVLLEDIEPVRLSVASAQAGTLVLDLVLQAPTCYAHDARYLAVPADWLPAFDPAVRARRARAPGDECPTNFEKPEWLAFPVLEPRAAAERIVAFAGRLALGADHIARVEIDTAGRLAEPPRELATAILVDGSRSLSADEREAQRSFVDAYLREVPDSHVQVIAYARRATPLLTTWTTAAAARAPVGAALRALAPANGSNVDVALAEATRWLDRIGGTRRVIVLTDERLAQRLVATPAKLANLVPTGVVVHAGVLTGGDELPIRDQGATLEPLALATAGAPFRTGKIAADEHVDWLVRARTIDQLHIKAPGWTRDAISTCSDVLAEGSGCTIWATGDGLSGPILVEGYVWGHRIERVLRPDPNRALDLARQRMFLPNPEDLQLRIERVARSLSHSWSLYAAWGNKLAYENALGLRGVSCCHSATPMRGGVSGVFGTGHVGLPPPPLDLRPQLAAKLAACKTTGTATIETTFEEIVDVTVDVRDPAAKSCVEEAIWTAMLRVPKEYPTAVARLAF